MGSKSEHTASGETPAVAAVERKLKVVVIIDVPEGPLLSCRIEELATPPVRGGSFVYENRLFDIERTVEVLGVNSPGSRMSTDEQLLNLLKLLSGDDQSMVRLASMRNIGIETEGLPGTGIILATTLSFTANADRLVYLRLRHVRTGTQTDGMIALARQAMETASGVGKKAVSEGATE